jgi:hypothetical protein
MRAFLRCAALGIDLLVGLPGDGRAATSIAAVTDDAASFAGQTVTVVGTVTEQRLGYGGESVYTLAGDDRRISVISRQSAPAVGDHLQVQAVVGFKAPDEEFTWPPVLRETARQTAP